MTYASSAPEFDSARCTGCGLCVLACPCHAVSLQAGRLAFRCGEHCESMRSTLRPSESSLCPGAYRCEDVCPTGALSCGFDIIADD